jgi:hypothetical protein
MAIKVKSKRKSNIDRLSASIGSAKGREDRAA